MENIIRHINIESIFEFDSQYFYLVVDNGYALDESNRRNQSDLDFDIQVLIYAKKCPIVMFSKPQLRDSFKIEVVNGRLFNEKLLLSTIFIFFASFLISLMYLGYLAK